MDKSNKLIFLDIDGTLTEAGTNEAPESAAEAIKEAREGGNLVFICTGRNRGMLSPVLKYGFDGYIGSAGGYIVANYEVIFDCPMPEADRDGMMAGFREAGIFFTVETLDDTFTDDAFKEFLKNNAENGGNSELLRWRRQIEKALNIKSMNDYDGRPVYKMIFMCQDDKQLTKLIEKYNSDYLFCVQEKDKYGIINGEIINRKFDKGQAVKRVCEYYGADINDTFGFGDSMNDKEMIETVGTSVCMANGSKAIKEMSDYVCESVAEDGISKAFKKYGLSL